MVKNNFYLERFYSLKESYVGKNLQESIHTYYTFISQWTKNKKILDAACGSGYGSSLLQENGAQKVLGLDISQEAIRFAQNRYGNENVSFETFDLEMGDFLTLKHKFDVVVSMETIEHLNNPEKFVQNISLIMKKEDAFVLSTPNKWMSERQGIRNPYHIREFTYEELSTLLKKYFSEVHFFGLAENVEKFTFLNRILKKYFPRFIKKRIPLGLRFRIMYFINKKDVIHPSTRFIISDKNISESAQFIVLCQNPC